MSAFQCPNNSISRPAPGVKALTLNQHSTWPVHPNYVYRCTRRGDRTAHAYPIFPSCAQPLSTRVRSLCDKRLGSKHAPPKEGTTMVCVDCYRAVLRIVTADEHSP